MPIPVFLIGVGAATGTFGLGKSIKAGVDQHDAKTTNEAAKRIIDRAKDKIETCRINCGDGIKKLGERKITLLDGSIKLFITEFEKLNHVELQESPGLMELNKLALDKKEFAELKDMQTLATSMVGGVASGAMAGAITAFGAYSAAGAFATASTGTAIASLSGAAATNATLAFFGGGAKAAGGFGMMGGSAVLGGLVAGPALAVLGLVVGAKASKNKDEAYSNLAKAHEFEEEMNVASSMCIGIRKRAAMFDRFLLSLDAIFVPLVYQMKNIIETKGCDFRNFDEEEKNIVAEAMALAGAIKTILDTTILDEEGNLTEESEKIIDVTKEKIDKAVA